MVQNAGGCFANAQTFQSILNLLTCVSAAAFRCAALPLSVRGDGGEGRISGAPTRSAAAAAAAAAARAVGPVRLSEASGPYAPGSASPHWFFRALTSFALQPSTLYSSACVEPTTRKVLGSAILRGFSWDDSQL